MVRRPVGIGQWRQRDGHWLADEPTEHQGYAVAFLDVGQTAPLPLPIGVHHLDAVRRRSANPVAMSRRDRDHGFDAVDEELGCSPRALMSRDLAIQILPLRTAG